MTRVSTYGNYNSALLDLMSAQARGAEAQQRVSTQKNATDLSGFGRQSETLTALKSAEARLAGFIDTGKAVAARLTAQDLAMNQVADGILSLRDAVANALSVDSGATLDVELQNQFDTVRAGLMAKHQGDYLFAGSATATAPLSAKTLGDLTAAPAVADVFENDQLRSVSRVSETTSMQTGVLADELGGDILTIIRDMQNFHTGGGGPLTGKLTPAQKTFLTSQIDRLNAAYANVIDRTAATGLQAAQVDKVVDQQESQSMALNALVADRTDADMAKAITDLEMSQVAIQASARVISALRETSLLEYLRY